MWETLPAPIAVWLPAGSVQVWSSSGETTDHDHARTPPGSAYPGPVQNGVPHRFVQLNAAGPLSAPSIV